MNRRRFLQSSAAAAALIPTARVLAQPGQPAGICPRGKPPARTLSVFDLRELTSSPADFRLTLHCLQGIVNRSQPRLYLIQDHYDELWLDWLKERGDLDSVQMLEIGEVLSRFLPEVRVMYVTDPAIPASINVATMLAGLDNALVSTPALVSQFPLPFGEYPDGAKFGYDLRRFHWRKDVDAYRWFFREHESEMSRTAIAMLDPATTAVRDYLITHKIPTVWISAPGDAGHNAQADYEAELQFARTASVSGTACGWPASAASSKCAQAMTATRPR